MKSKNKINGKNKNKKKENRIKSSLLFTTLIPSLEPDIDLT